MTTPEGAEEGAAGEVEALTCPSECAEQNHPGHEHEAWERAREINVRVDAELDAAKVLAQVMDPDAFQRDEVTERRRASRVKELQWAARRAMAAEWAGRILSSDWLADRLAAAVRAAEVPCLCGQSPCLRTAVGLDPLPAPVAPSTPEGDAEAWPIGLKVYVWRFTYDEPPVVSRTRLKPWALGDGTKVVSVEGLTGGIALSHVLPAPDPEQVTQAVRDALAGAAYAIGNTPLPATDEARSDDFLSGVIWARDLTRAAAKEAGR